MAARMRKEATPSRVPGADPDSDQRQGPAPDRNRNRNGKEVSITKEPENLKAEDVSPYWPILAPHTHLPAWLQDNDYIINYHPMPTNTYARSFRLLRCLHMETINIWTHLLGSVAFLVAAMATLPSLSSSASTAASSTSSNKPYLFPLLIFLAASSLCFSLSATFHTLRSHSYTVHHFWGRMDLLGICILAVGAGFSSTHFAFYCETDLGSRYRYLNLASGLIAAMMLFDTGGGGVKMRRLRGSVFAALAVSALGPVGHFVLVSGWEAACKRIGVQWYLAELAVMVVGVVVFVARVPERWSPGRFDIWGHSHQLFHFCALIGAGFHFVALLFGYRYRQSHPGC
jgi:adiponectin receptor